ncbi:M3 family oligoendopeptidase [Conexibacter sp. DBS9H8]|uniref:M3 family oligoendopeptidase n=1 Tax=Conexibacter sp. DBS9H8 TaxID=2937801 RepID=UPI002010919F|nr:M3 family oligoendopeptidase [Conexibacter sp. DBS9H8]
MATSADALADPALLATAWDLSPLIDGDPAGGFDRLLGEAQERARTFAAGYAGTVANLDADGLVAAMTELAAIHDLAGRAASFASLNFSTDTADAARGALLARMQEQVTAIETALLFFDLEWAALEDADADALLTSAGDRLAFCDHHLRSARRYRTHLLSEAEEKILAEKDLTASGAWTRLFGELVSALRVDLDGERLGFELALSRLQDPDRERRRQAAEAITEALTPGLRTRAFIFNTLIFDKSVEDRLRRYPHWIASRNLANEASDESVEALITAVTGRYDIPQRWYRLKARLLGIPKLADYDRSAPLSAQEKAFTYAEAVELVRSTYEAFSPVAGAAVGRFFDEGWIDAPLRPNKRSGAFCASTVPSVHPYVLLNYTATRRDVLTMAHELGHGLHGALAQRQGIFHQSTPLTLAETASTFGESLVFERLLDASTDDRDRLGLLASRIDDAIATVFRQVAMNRFEDLVHTRRRAEGELGADDFSAAWHETQSALMGDSLEITDGYRTWWSYIPHFINTPGYVYAYAYGQLLALSAYGRYKTVGEAFVPAYLDLLASGGSKSPEALGEMIGINLADPGFWDAGLRLVDAQLSEAEQLVSTLGL